MNRLIQNILQEYPSFLADIKTRIRSSQYEAMKAVNTQTLELYWYVGKQICNH